MESEGSKALDMPSCHIDEQKGVYVEYGRGVKAVEMNDELSESEDGDDDNYKAVEAPDADNDDNKEEEGEEREYDGGDDGCGGDDDLGNKSVSGDGENDDEQSTDETEDELEYQKKRRFARTTSDRQYHYRNRRNKSVLGKFGRMRCDTLEHCWESFQLFREACGAFVNHPRVQTGVVVLIAINAIMMGVGTFPMIKNNENADHIFEVIDLVFLCIFTVELLLQFVYHGYRLLLDGWLVFDLIIIVMSWAFKEAQIIRAFRIFRALRLITRIAVMKNLVVALFNVMPRMGGIAILLGLLSYIFGVMFTQLFKETNPDYFGDLPKSLFTLFQMTTMDSWTGITRDVKAEHSWAWFPILMYVIVTGFIVMNLIIAVICDAVSDLHEDEKAKLHGSFDDNSLEFEMDDDDDDSDAQDNSKRRRRRQSVRGQLHSLENDVRDLTMMQTRTLEVLSALNRQMKVMDELLLDMQQDE